MLVISLGLVHTLFHLFDSIYLHVYILDLCSEFVFIIFTFELLFCTFIVFVMWTLINVLTYLSK